MKDKDYKKLLELIDKLAHKCHLAALHGTKDFEFMRGVATHLEIRFEEKEIVHAEQELKKLEEEIRLHLVEAAQGEEFKILKNLEKAIKNLYLAMFNALVFERREIWDMDAFVKDVIKNIPSSDFKKEVAKMIDGIVDRWKTNLRSMQQAANAINATAAERGTIALKMTDMLHTHGASFMKRLQEQRLLKDAHKEEVKAVKAGQKITKRKFSSKEEAEKLLEEMKVDETKSIEEYKKACKLLALDWESALEALDKILDDVKAGAEAHELPKSDEDQIKEVRARIVHKLVEPFTHSLEQGVNQLDSIRKGLADHAKELERS